MTSAISVAPATRRSVSAMSVTLATRRWASAMSVTPATRRRASAGQVRPARRWPACGQLAGLAAALLLLVGCSGHGGDAARPLADRLAQDAGFDRVVIAAGPFHLLAFLRLSDSPTALLRVYIEGDGHAWTTRDMPSDDPTPWSPVALELATHDAAPSVAWLARPCQYGAPGTDAACNQSVWTDARYSPAVIASTNAALDRLKALAGASRLELVGYSGGGAVAVLAAAHRTDLRGLRTVAANLDTTLWTREQSVTPLSGSLNPVEVAPLLATLPQRHFVGGADRTVDESVVRSFAAAAGAGACLTVTVVPGLQHGEDWVAVWPELLSRALPRTCTNETLILH
jgi:hypothetical protein